MKKLDNKGIATDIIDVWLSLKAKLNDIYHNNEVPKFVIPWRDKAKKYLDDTFQCTALGSTYCRHGNICWFLELFLLYVYSCRYTCSNGISWI